MRVMPRQILIWCCCLLLVQHVTALTGDNVCNRTQLETETIEYVVAEPVTYRLFTWCLKMPPRCSKYATIMKERIKTKLQINNHTIDFCCDEYVQLETYCVPQCNKTECPHMNCDAENKCVCEAGYYGQRCHRTCRTGFWGENCANKCVCNGEPCNLKNGDCIPSTTTATPPITVSSNNVTLPYSTTESKESKSTSATRYININNNKTSPKSSNPLIFSTQRTKSEKTELSQDVQESELDPTMIPIGILLEDMDTTLLPEDEVIIVYPSMQTKYYTPTRQPELKKLSSEQKISLKTTTQKFLQPNVTKAPYSSDKIKKQTTDYFSKMHEIKFNKNKYIDSNTDSTTEKIKTNVENNNNNYQKANKLKVNNDDNNNSNKKYHSSTVVPIAKNIKYNPENLMTKKGNGLPPPVPDGSDNSLQINGNTFKNVTVAEENEGSVNNIIIKSNEIQRDMEEINNNFSRPNIDTTVNSSLVKAKWNSALGMIDFSSPSIIILISVTVILSTAVIFVIITHCKRNKNDSSSSSFYDNNVKASHHDNIAYGGHYATTDGQSIFFCPAFTNTYAFELAQELREAHYDHPRSARCLINEPVYAELQY